MVHPSHFNTTNWPAYAILTGHFDEWLTGVLYQIERESDKTLYHSITLIFKIDPVLLTLGTAGFVYTLIKRDYFPLLWIIPYLLFLYYSGWVTHFHWMLLIPAPVLQQPYSFKILRTESDPEKKLLRY